jgi:type I restriction enzyme M protein
MVFKKCRENPNDILFIDASNDFEKVKTQNILRNEHIAKIIDHYRNRKETEKYSKKASLAEIASNDYNLNIPRYVDTFEAEASIDINTIANQLQTLEKAMKATDASIALFCKELGIAAPF